MDLLGLMVWFGVYNGSVGEGPGVISCVEYMGGDTEFNSTSQLGPAA